MNTLVTGGAGFIGSNVVRLLLERGHSVSILDNLSTGYRVNIPKSGAAFVEGDILDRDQVAKAAEGVEVVFHLAASVGNLRSIEDPQSDSMINVIGTLNVLESARLAGVRKVVCSSSAAIFGELKTLPIREDHPAEPDSPYGVSKLAAEKHALCYPRLHGMEVVCLRYFNVYGVNQRYDLYGNVIPIFTTLILKGQPLTIYGDGEQTRDFINVADVARANVMAGESRGVTGAFNLGSGTAISINKLVTALGDAAGKRPEANHAAPRPGEVLHSLADTTAIREALGFQPQVLLADGLREYVSWLAGELQEGAALA